MMSVKMHILAVVGSFGVLLAAPLSAEVKVKVSNTHLCCGACVKAVDKTLGEIKGVKHEANQDDGTISLTADSVATAQQAVDALAGAGFHGKLDNAEVKFKPIDAPQGKVGRLEVSGIHNCCGACTKAIKSALKGVEGVQADTAKPKADSFVVEGNFSAAAVVESLLNAGFHVRVKK